jgi:PAS domain S-box-containing protein
MSLFQVLPLPIKPYSLFKFTAGTALLLTTLLLLALKAIAATLFFAATLSIWYAGLKSTKQELETERDIISKVIDIAACLIVVLDREGRIVRFNQACEKTTGYSFAEVENKCVWDVFLIPEEVEPIKTYFTKIKTEDFAYEYQNYWLTKGGDRRLISWSNTVINDREGWVEYVIATGIDITDRQQAEIALALSYEQLETRVKQRTAELTVAKEALQAQEERFRSLSSCSPVGIFIADIQGRCTYANPRFQAIFELSCDEILDAGWVQTIHPEERDRVLASWANYTRAGSEYAIEYRLQPSAGILRWVNVCSSPMFSDSGELIGHVGTVTDITDRQQVQAALSSSEQQLRTLLENTPDIIIRIDKELRYVYVNPAVGKTQGQPVSYFIGKTSQEIGMPPELCQRWDETLHKVLETGREEILEFQAPSSRGIRSYQSRIVPEFDKNGFPEYALVVARDITELQVAEIQKAQLIVEQAAREKAELEQQRSAFLAEVSKMLAAAFDGETVLQTVAELAVPIIADGCYIHLTESDGIVRQVAFVHTETDTVNAVKNLKIRNPLDENFVNGYPLVIRTGKSELIVEVDEKILAAGTQNEAELEILRSLNVGSHACVPMTARGRVIGAISCFTSKFGRRYNSEDMAMLEDLAYHVGLALDNARLYTEAQQALAQTSESFALIDSLLEASPLGICFLDREMRFLRINQVLAELNGLPAQQHLGQDYRQLLPESAAQFAPVIQQVLETGQPLLNVEISGESKGKPGYFGHWVGNYYPVKNASGQILGAGIILTDITAAKQTEIALIESEKRFRSVVESNTIGIGFWETDGKVTEANDALLDILGYSREDLILGNLCWLKMTPPEYQHLDRAIIAQIKIEGKCTPFEKEYIRKDGSRVWVLIGGAHFQGCTDKGSFFVLDISDRKQAQNQIRENEARIAHQLAELNLVYNTAPVGLSFVDTHLRYVRMNEYLAAINGRSIADHIGRTVREAIPELADLVEPIYQQVLATQTPVLDWEVKAETLQQPGVLRDWLVSFYPVCDESGTLLGVSNVVADISDRKQAEAERAQLLDRERAARAEAEAINRLKDEFLGTLSHELRTPLNVIMGWSQVLRDRRYTEETLTCALEAIDRQAKVQTQLVEDLLDVSRIIQGKLCLKNGWFNIVKAIEFAVSSVTFAAQTKSVTVKSEFDPNVSLMWGDGPRLQQVVSNLLTNAVKFTPSGGTVVLRLSAIVANAESNHLQIQVSDNGKGISPEFLPYVFDRFRQADGSITRDHGGLGLGLAIVRHLVELHGGTVRAESPGEGKGATFTVTLPLKQPKSQKLKLREKRQFELLRSNLLGGLKVLVVDDEPDNREFLTVILSGCGTSPIAAASVAEAIEILEHSQPDILVSDIGMPIEDGYSLIRKIRAAESGTTKHLPAVALTAYATEQDRNRAIEAGYDEHLTKPIDPDRFVAVLVKLTGSNSS